MTQNGWWHIQSKYLAGWRHRRPWRLVGCLTAVLTMACSADSATGPIQPPVVGSPEITSVQILPDTTTLARDSIFTPKVLVTSSSGSTVQANLTWQSRDTSVAKVDQTGNVTAIGVGYTKVLLTATAKSGSSTGIDSLYVKVVNRALGAIIVSPKTLAVAVGDTVLMSDTLKDDKGHIIIDSTIHPTWTTSDPKIIQIDSSGTIRGVGNGTATVTATVGGVSGFVALKVTNRPISSVTLAPGSATIAVGGTVTFTATFKDDRGTVVPSSMVGTISWTTPDSVILSLSQGVGRGLSGGTATVKVSAASLSATSLISVTTPGAGPPAAINLSPTGVNIPVDSTVALYAVVVDGNGKVVVGAPIVWSSGNTAVATVSATGRMTAVGPGAADIKATTPGSGSSISSTMVVTVTAPPPSLSANVVPSSIVSDCSVDVTAALQAWIDSRPDGSTLTFGQNACYNIDGGLVITDRNGLTFEGNGSTFKVVTRSTRDRANWTFKSGSNLTLRNMVAKGANPHAGLFDDAYDTRLEGQHAYRFEGTQIATLDAVQAYDVWGDFVEAEPDWRGVGGAWNPVRNLIVKNSHFERNGRMGIGLTDVDGFTLQDSYVGDVRWSIIDIELDDLQEVGRNITINRNHFGAMSHYVLVSAGQGTNTTLGNIVFRDNVQDTDSKTCLAPFAIQTPREGTYYSGVTIEGNTLHPMTGGAAVFLTRVNDAVIRNNTITARTHGGCGGNFAVQLADSHNVAVTGNVLKDSSDVGLWWTTTLSKDNLSSGVTESANVVNK